MKKILYYSLVDWDWIKQRPQFLAFGLSEWEFDVRVIYLWQYRRKNLKKVESGAVQLCPIYRFPPLGFRFSWINKINQWLTRRKVAREIRSYQPDVLWLTHPSQLADVPDSFCGKVVYDCMDDYDVLGTSPDSREEVIRQEQSLCDRADVIFVSSNLLRKKLCDRNPNKESQIHLVRNGCSGELYPGTTGKHKEKIYAGYVGTIAQWFDFDIVLKSLERIPALEYFLIGPVNVKNPPEHDRIHYLGTIAHEDLFEAVREMDCMVMPFILEDIVLSVDPVKLYEYISWQKNIVTVSYPEIQRFGEFVYQYSNLDEYCAALLQIGRSDVTSYSEKDARRFLTENSWKNRVGLIRDALQKLK